MRRTVLGVLLLLFLPTPARAADGAAVVDDQVVRPRLHELTVSSPALGRDGHVRVLLPSGYDDPANAGRTWPILWLLHGAGDDETSWTQNTDIEALTADLPLVVAMPEAGRNATAGWYSDWVSGPAWETFHLQELLPLVEARYHAGGARERRAVAGLSMGGYGAMAYAARHPDLWVAAASFSGVVHPTLIGPGGSLVFDLLHDYTGTPGAPVWGPYSTSEANWHGHDPWDLAANLRPLAGALWFRSGNGIPCPGDSVTSAPLEIGVYPMNLSLDARLASLGIAHQWFDRGCGTHEWRHWTDDIRTVLPSIMAVLAAPPPPPASFDYRFTDDTASVFGWTFSVTDRSAGAMTFVDDASASGLTVSGSGTLHVTPPTGGSFSTALTATPLRITLATTAPPTASTAPPSPTTTTTTVPRPDPVAPLPPTGGDQDGLLVAAAVAVVTAGAARRLSGAGAGGHWPTRSG